MLYFFMIEYQTWKRKVKRSNCLIYLALGEGKWKEKSNSYHVLLPESAFQWCSDTGEDADESVQCLIKIQRLILIYIMKKISIKRHYRILLLLRPHKSSLKLLHMNFRASTETLQSHDTIIQKKRKSRRYEYISSTPLNIVTLWNIKRAHVLWFPRSQKPTKYYTSKYWSAHYRIGLLLKVERFNLLL